MFKSFNLFSHISIIPCSKLYAPFKSDNQQTFIFENSILFFKCSLKDVFKLIENGSSESAPTIQSNNIHISSGVFAKHPGLVKIGKLSTLFSPDLSVGINPVVGLNP